MRASASRLASALLCAAILVVAPASAEIALSPLRQVITPAAPIATYQVSNPSRRIIEGRVSWLDLTATETGYQAASPAERAARSAAPWLAVWPATFRLEPGGRTAITVRLKEGASPPKGERRSHLLIETAAFRTPLRKASGSLELDIDLGVSTPVILRAGPMQAAAAFGATRLLRNADGLLELETYLSTDGPATAYGRLVAEMRGAGVAAPKPVARLDNVAVYPEAPRRRFVLPLNADRLPGGVMDLRFEGAEEFEGALFAHRSFEIAPPPTP
jgi:hypothetical protein